MAPDLKEREGRGFIWSLPHRRKYQKEKIKTGALYLLSMPTIKSHCEEYSCMGREAIYIFINKVRHFKS
jgi:hypothetical protein